MYARTRLIDPHMHRPRHTLTFQQVQHRTHLLALTASHRTHCPSRVRSGPQHRSSYAQSVHVQTRLTNPIGSCAVQASTKASALTHRKRRSARSAPPSAIMMSVRLRGRDARLRAPRSSANRLPCDALRRDAHTRRVSRAGSARPKEGGPQGPEQSHSAPQYDDPGTRDGGTAAACPTGLNWTVRRVASKQPT
jgi:hypothetical protein